MVTWILPWFECDINKLMISSVESLENVTLNGGPWDPYSEADRQQDVERSAIVVRIPDLASRILVDTFTLQKKTFIGRGMKDRIIVGDSPIQLMKGDRLEPTLAMRDVSKFEDFNFFENIQKYSFTMFIYTENDIESRRNTQNINM